MPKRRIHRPYFRAVAFVVSGVVGICGQIIPAQAQVATPIQSSPGVEIPPASPPGIIVAQANSSSFDSSRTYGGLVSLAPGMQAETVGNQDPDSDTDETGELRPLQIRELSTKVKPVNISETELGTGVTPSMAEPKKELPLSFLPDGIARGASYKSVHWRPSMIAHHPLIFEDAMLERHGHTRWGCLQPVASCTKFWGTILLHPYLNTLSPPWECQYSLGQYRPGTCAPVLRDHIPYDRRAAAVETLTMAGFFWGAPL